MKNDVEPIITRFTKRRTRKLNFQKIKEIKEQGYWFLVPLFLLALLPVPLFVTLVIPSVEGLLESSDKSFAFVVLTLRPKCMVLPFHILLRFMGPKCTKNTKIIIYI